MNISGSSNREELKERARENKGGDRKESTLNRGVAKVEAGHLSRWTSLECLEKKNGSTDTGKKSGDGGKEKASMSTTLCSKTTPGVITSVSDAPMELNIEVDGSTASVTARDMTPKDSSYIPPNKVGIQTILSKTPAATTKVVGGTLHPYVPLGFEPLKLPAVKSTKEPGAASEKTRKAPLAKRKEVAGIFRIGHIQPIKVRQSAAA